jgi:hypothetical protein
MALEQIGKNVLGAAAGELLNFLLDAKVKIMEFKVYFERLKVSLEDFMHQAELINEFNKELGLERWKYHYHLFQSLKEGMKLVKKCEKLPWWKFWKKYTYSKKLLELEVTILRFSQMNMQAEMNVDLKKALCLLVKLEKKVDVALDASPSESIFESTTQGNAIKGRVSFTLCVS